jgi:hypothetical protein
MEFRNRSAVSKKSLSVGLGVKFQRPNPGFQIISNSQTPIFELFQVFGNYILGHYLLMAAWDLALVCSLHLFKKRTRYEINLDALERRASLSTAAWPGV